MASIVDLSPVFVDFEASGLAVDCFPVEVGWAYLDGGHVISEGHLIRPGPDWDLESNWDETAEALHRISKEHLLANGEPAFMVANRMNEMLAGKEVFADSPFDRQWMDQLFEAAGADPSFNMRTMLAPALVDQLCLSLGLYDSEILKISSVVNQRYPHTHRAAEDARQWAELWNALKSSPFV